MGKGGTCPDRKSLGHRINEGANSFCEMMDGQIVGMAVSKLCYKEKFKGYVLSKACSDWRGGPVASFSVPLPVHGEYSLLIVH